MNIAPEPERDNFEFEDADDIIGIAKSVVDGHHPGILATVDEDGKPAVRWMSTLSFDQFPIFYTLTRPDSRKVAQIEKTPVVNWMFSNHNRTLILNLIGRARVLKDTPTLKRVWQKVVDKSLPYFMDQYAKGLGFVVIETRVEVIECTSPKSALCFKIEAAEMAEPYYR
jgi:general stress protein 26